MLYFFEPVLDQEVCPANKPDPHTCVFPQEDRMSSEILPIFIDVLKDDIDGLAAISGRSSCGPSLFKWGNPLIKLFASIFEFLRCIVFWKLFS